MVKQTQTDGQAASREKKKGKGHEQKEPESGKGGGGSGSTAPVRPISLKEITTAAREMAQLIACNHAVLIPVPASSGSIAANLALAQAIQRERPTLAVIPALRRRASVDSTCRRAKAGLL